MSEKIFILCQGNGPDNGVGQHIGKIIGWTHDWDFAVKWAEENKGYYTPIERPLPGRKTFLVKDFECATHIIAATHFVFACGEFVTFYEGEEVIARFNGYKSFRKIAYESVPEPKS